jgi:hypothetical protein
VLRRTLLAATLASLPLAACADDPPTSGLGTPPNTSPTPTTDPVAVPASPATTITPPSTAPSSTAPAVGSTVVATTEPVPTTTEPELEIPEGVLVAVPTQNREDPAKNQFQVQVHNGTGDRFDLAGVQFVWDGYTTPMTDRDSIIVGGQMIDFPVPFPGATCVGDGTRATMPSLDDARVVMLLDSGQTVEMPIVDKWHLARKLYEEDCERQMIEAEVGIEWVDLHEEDFEGRPVTAGALQLTRRAGDGEVTVLSVSHTIPFFFSAVDTAVGEPVVTLAAGEDTASAPVRFLESRCDPHALAEIKQPTKFVAQVQLGDGSQHAYIIYPERDYWTPMRLTADKACMALGKVVFAGE